ncbi:hypothetical protein [Roseicitreum antarcticum]|uniref:hypothetical protein n=1 Tax=Roseicitreum antarcticum TaxID=564137 RepID=UPI000B89A43D|nr:hypothetical protein [Roseicitreum antarcticum]
MNVPKPILERTLSAKIDEIGDGIAIALTDSILDLADDYEEFDEARSDVKGLFPKTFFYMS